MKNEDLKPGDLIQEYDGTTLVISCVALGGGSRLIRFTLLNAKRRLRKVLAIGEHFVFPDAISLNSLKTR